MLYNIWPQRFMSVQRGFDSGWSSCCGGWGRCGPRIVVEFAGDLCRRWPE
ncbi:hypothetical protein HanRHA438_Chr17g0820041 [Helianthus annuus]|nr:hypothetical protein HanIR_Chr17g0879021 [Helianthus annuus]KAJ0826939.1 hypothetical protein HanRHA438_Chr17g0820041 [Helianthus annuus]